MGYMQNCQNSTIHARCNCWKYRHKSLKGCLPGQQILKKNKFKEEIKILLVIISPK